jgi:hypothetical protein
MSAGVHGGLGQGTFWVMDDVKGTDSGDGGAKVGYATVGCDVYVEEGVSVVIHDRNSSQCIFRF